MKQGMRIAITGIFAALFAAGLVLIFSAASIGTALAGHARAAASSVAYTEGGIFISGGMPAETYYFLMSAHALSCQMGGAVCALVGGAGALLFGQPRQTGAPEASLSEHRHTA